MIDNYKFMSGISFCRMSWIMLTLCYTYLYGSFVCSSILAILGEILC